MFLSQLLPHICLDVLNTGYRNKFYCNTSAAIVASKQSIHSMSVGKLYTHVFLWSDKIFHGILSYIFIQGIHFMNDNKGGNWQWDQGWDDQKDVRGEIWRTLWRRVWKSISHPYGVAVVAVYSLSYTVGTQLPQDPSKHPSVSLPSLCDLIPHRFPTACQSFSPTIKKERGFCGMNTLYVPLSCRYLFCLELQNWGNILMRTCGGQHLSENNGRCSSMI